MRSASVTLTAGDSSIEPFSLMRPSPIIRSTSRREATPARARSLAIRSGVMSTATSGALRRSRPPAGPGLAAGLATGVHLVFAFRSDRHPQTGHEGHLLCASLYQVGRNALSTMLPIDEIAAKRKAE